MQNLSVVVTETMLSTAAALDSKKLDPVGFATTDKAVTESRIARARAIMIYRGRVNAKERWGKARIIRGLGRGLYRVKPWSGSKPMGQFSDVI